MPSNKIEEAEILLYLAGALPWRRRAGLLLRSQFDRDFLRELRHLREEARAFEKEIRPALEARLGARSPVLAAPARSRRRPFPESAVAAWGRMLREPVTAFAGIALCALAAGCLLALQSPEPGGMGGGRPCLAAAEGHLPRPMLILGY
jgi:hypothetical protein